MNILNAILCFGLFALLASCSSDSGGGSKSTAKVSECTTRDEEATEVAAGTAEDPILICNYEELKMIATHGLDKHYILGTDIDASDSWSEGTDSCNAYDPDGDPDIPETTPCTGMAPLGNLTGAFDGAGHEISNLFISSDAAKIGLFSDLAEGKSIKNVHLESIRVHGRATGAKVGGLLGSSSGVVSNASVSGKFSIGVTATSDYHMGGLVGAQGGAAGSEISNVRAFDIEMRDTGTSSALSTLVGSSAGGTISNCSVGGGDVQGGNRAGGVVGSASGTLSIESCAVEDTAMSSFKNVGGLVGYINATEVTINESYAKNTEVTSTSTQTYYSSAGGLVGLVNSGNLHIIMSYAHTSTVTTEGLGGGLLGHGGNVQIFYSHSYLGSVTANTAGGLVGISGTGTSIYSSASHTEVSGASSSGGLVGHLQQTELKNSYVTGAVEIDDSGTEGGLIAFPSSSEVSNSFWDTEATGQADSDGQLKTLGTGLTTANMQLGCGGSNSSNSICSLGATFSFGAGRYPKIRTCVSNNCTASDTSTHTISSGGLVGGQDW